MIKVTITMQDGRGSSTCDGKMVTGDDIKGLFKCAGVSLGRILANLPQEAASMALDALMDGMAVAKQVQENK